MGRKQKVSNKIEEVRILHIPVKYSSLVSEDIQRDPIDFSKITGYNESEINENFHPVNNTNNISQPLVNPIEAFKDVHLNRPFINCDVRDNENRNIQTIVESYNILHDFNCLKKGDWVKKTNVFCWWCCHPFNSMPLGMPFVYNGSLEIFKVKGCFCSFNCIISHAESIGVKDRSLIKYMYKKISGEPISTNIQKAPPRELLKIFGGHLSIEEFRKSFNDDSSVKYSNIEYPMVAYNVQIEQNIKRIVNNHQHNNKSLSDDRLSRAQEEISSKVSKNNAIPKMGGVVKTKLSDFFNNIIN
jgi:hypothetical protein